MKFIKPIGFIIMLHFFFKGNAQFTLRSGVNVTNTKINQNTISTVKPYFLLEFSNFLGSIRRNNKSLVLGELYYTREPYYPGNSYSLFGAGLGYIYRLKRYPHFCIPRNRWVFRPYFKGSLRGEMFKLSENAKIKGIVLPYLAAGSMIGILGRNRIELEAGIAPMLYTVYSQGNNVKNVSAYFTVSIPIFDW